MPPDGCALDTVYRQWIQDEMSDILPREKGMEDPVAGLEKKHGIRVQWQENDATFQNAQQRLSAKKKSNELLRLHKMASERTFLLELKTKYADGQAIGIKLASHIDKVVNSMKQGLVKLNLLMGDKIIAFDDKKIQVENSTSNLIHALIQMACQLISRKSWCIWCLWKTDAKKNRS